jgi:hypothetical protein
MIKLTEIVSNAGHYDPEKRAVSVGYRLRNFYVNPKFIISIADNEKLNKVHECEQIIEDLHPGARFTKLTMASGPHGATFYDILGSPEQNLENISKRNK